jgi:hypothetical protein
LVDFQIHVCHEHFPTVVHCLSARIDIIFIFGHVEATNIKGTSHSTIFVLHIRQVDSLHLKDVIIPPEKTIQF